MSRERLKRIWASMKYRCHGTGNSRAHANYRDRGIIVCDLWRENFELFERWSLNNGYADDLTIDRIDCDGNYCPENCRWISRSENSKNRYHSGIIASQRLVKVEVSGSVKKIMEYYSTLNPEGREAFMNLIDNFISLSKGDSNENESEETGKTS